MWEYVAPPLGNPFARPPDTQVPQNATFGRRFSSTKLTGPGVESDQAGAHGVNDICRETVDRVPYGYKARRGFPQGTVNRRRES